MIKWVCVGLVSVFLMGCKTSAPVGQCAGFTPPPAPRKPAELVKNEPDLARWVVGTDEIGNKLGCW